MRYLPAVLAAAAILASGCFASPPPADLAVASYPAAYLAETLAGTDLMVADLASSVGLHDFEPRARDLDQLRSSEHLIIWSGSVESWAQRAAKSLGRSAPNTFDLMRLPAGETLIEGEADHGHDHGHGHGSVDPHTWIDPVAMKASAEALRHYLTAWYPTHADNITARTAHLAAELDALHDAFSGLADCRHDTIITNHGAYAYLARRYGIRLFSLHGIEPGSEPSPATINQAIRTIKDLGLPVLFIEEGTDPKAVGAIRDETGVRIRVLHTLETRPATGDYLTAQHQNVQELRAALACP